MSSYSAQQWITLGQIRNNNPNLTEFTSNSGLLDWLENDYSPTSNYSWELLGRYISRNQHLKKIDLSLYLNDDRMSRLFSSLVSSNSVEHFTLIGNSTTSIGINSFQSMLPFFSNSRITRLNLNNNSIINNEYFSALVKSVGSNINHLRVADCSIDSIPSLDNCPYLELLDLSGNYIRGDGYQSLVKGC